MIERRERLAMRVLTLGQRASAVAAAFDRGLLTPGAGR